MLRPRIEQNRTCSEPPVNQHCAAPLVRPASHLTPLPKSGIFHVVTKALADALYARFGIRKKTVFRWTIRTKTLGALREL